MGAVEEEEEDRRDGAWDGRDELFFRERDFFLPSNRVALSPKIIYIRAINRRGKKRNKIKRTGWNRVKENIRLSKENSTEQFVSQI